MWGREWGEGTCTYVCVHISILLLFFIFLHFLFSLFSLPFSLFLLLHSFFPLSPPPRLDLTKSSILPNLIELTSDEECSVRVTAVETLVELISFLDEGTLQSETVPLLKKFCEEALSAGDGSLLTVARLLGRMCHELKGEGVRVWRGVCVQFAGGEKKECCSEFNS